VPESSSCPRSTDFISNYRFVVECVEFYLHSACILLLVGHWSQRLTVACYQLQKFNSYTTYIGARIAQWYSAGLRARWSGVRVPAGSGNFSLHSCVQTGFGAHPASYPIGTRGSFPGRKAAGTWSWQFNLVPRSILRGDIPTLSQFVFLA
jgi:hypothetical protein